MKKSLTMLLALVMVLAMMLPVAAAKSDFVPSAEVKPAPDVVDKPTEDGTPARAEIIMPDGTVIPVPGSSIIITPLEGADSAVPPSIGEDLNGAYDELLNTDDLNDLISNLEDILDQIDENTDVEDLVINDLFHVYVDGEYSKYLEEGGVLKITFKVDQGILLAITKSDGKWNALFGDNFIDNGDGTYTLMLSKAGVIAFLKSAASVDVDPENPGVSSPTTGDVSVMYVVGGLVLLLAAVAFGIAAKKQKA